MFVVPAPSFNYGVAVTPSDTTANILNARFLQNIGTAGVFTVRQDVAVGGHEAAFKAPTAAATVVVYLGQGQTIECGASWVGVNTTSLGAGVSLVAYY